MSSVLYQSGAQLNMEEVVPMAAAVKGLTRSSILTQRRRIRIQAQGGRDYGSFSTTQCSGGGNQQIQFLLSDAGGLVDPASINLVYNICTATTTALNQAVPDDAHPFTRLQVSLNGQLLDDINSAAKNTNAEVNLSATKDWYTTAGSFCGFELLNNELNTVAATTPGSAALAGATFGAATQAANTLALGQYIQSYASAWADVSGNWANIEARYDEPPTTVNPLGGQQRVLPLGLISGIGRMKNYLPLNILGEMSFTFFTGSANEVLFSGTPTGSVAPDFCLRGVYLEADIVIPHPAYAEVLSRMANDAGETGLSLPYESTIVSQGGVMALATSLSDYAVVVSRATNNLVRSLCWFQPTAALTSAKYAIQSCFNHAGVNKIQWRIGSQFYPSIPAEGDADIWAMSASAYGTAGLNEQNGVANRILWAQTTPAAATSAHTGGEGFYKFDHADKFTPAYGFRVVKGASEEVQMDGVSLSGASGSQAVLAITAAPPFEVAPFVSLVATRVIQAANGQVRVLGA